MAVAFDVVSTPVKGTGVTSLTSTSFTIAGTANRCAALQIQTQTGGLTSFSASCGGATGTSVADNDSGTARVQIWQAINPSSGSQTCTASWTTASNAMLTAIVANGVDQTTGMNNANNTASGSTSVAIAVTSTNGDLTTTSYICTKTTTLSTDQTSEYSTGFPATPARTGGGDIGPGTGTTTHNWTGGAGGSSTWGAGANFVAAAGASFDVTTMFSAVIPPVISMIGRRYV